MKSTLSLVGSLTGWAGVVLCLASGLLRVSGAYQIAGYGTITLFIGGVGLIAAGCLIKLEGSQ